MPWAFFTICVACKLPHSVWLFCWLALDVKRRKYFDMIDIYTVFSIHSFFMEPEILNCSNYLSKQCHSHTSTHYKSSNMKKHKIMEMSEYSYVWMSKSWWAKWESCSFNWTYQMATPRQLPRPVCNGLKNSLQLRRFSCFGLQEAIGRFSCQQEGAVQNVSLLFSPSLIH